jgi:hypothetical protein
MLATLAPVLSGVGVAPATTGYFSIATQTVGAIPASSITFTSIPNTATHLQIRWLARGTAVSGSDVISLSVNSDTGSNYAFHRLYGDGSSANGNGYSSQTYIIGGDMPAATAGSNMFAAGCMDILDYADTNKYKTTRLLDGRDQNGSGFIWFNSGLWQNTNAITSLTFTAQNGSYAQYSSFALYGVK